MTVNCCWYSAQNAADAMNSGMKATTRKRSSVVTRELVNITQDQSLLDPYDFDTATPEIARISGAPERWMSDPQKIAAKRQGRAQAQAAERQIQAAPAQAALMSAAAKQHAAGMLSPQGTV